MRNDMLNVTLKQNTFCECHHPPLPLQLERMCGMKVKRDVGVQESASRNTRDVHTRIHKHPYRHTDQHRHTNQHRHTSLQNEPHRHTLRHTKRHTRRANQNRRTQISDSPVSVTSHFEKNALTSTNLISHIPSHFCASLDKPHKRIPHDDDLVDSPACWNATLDTRFDSCVWLYVCGCLCVVVCGYGCMCG